MMTTNRNLERRNRATIYQLKRRYGSTVSLFRMSSGSVNITTGKKHYKRAVEVVIPRCIVLPSLTTRNQTQTTAMTGSGKQFMYGGFYDHDAVTFLIDPAELANEFEIAIDDYIVFDDMRYDVKDIRESEFDSIWEVDGIAADIS